MTRRWSLNCPECTSGLRPSKLVRHHLLLLLNRVISLLQSCTHRSSGNVALFTSIFPPPANQAGCGYPIRSSISTPSNQLPHPRSIYSYRARMPSTMTTIPNSPSNSPWSRRLPCIQKVHHLGPQKTQISLQRRRSMMPLGSLRICGQIRKMRAVSRGWK